MGLEKLGKKLKDTLKAAAVVGSVMSGTPAEAQVNKHPEATEQTIDSLFQIEEFVAPTEGSESERRMLAEELFAHVMERAPEQPDMSREMLVPLRLSAGRVDIRILIFPQAREMRLLVIRGNDTPIAFIDSGITGTPAEHQLPIIEKGIPRPQAFLGSGEHEIANRLYLGLLRHLLSKF